MELFQYVDPIVGTVGDIPNGGIFPNGLPAAGGGKTYPGAVAPWGMVQFSPDTITGGDNGCGYSCHHETIEGFSINHLSGVGWYGELGNFQVMPVTGRPPFHSGTNAHCPYQPGTPGRESAFRHETEQAEAGSYAVTLDRYGIRAETTVTLRCGIMRMAFPASGNPRVLIDLSRRVGGCSESQQLKVLEDNQTIECSIRCPYTSGGWGHGDGHVSYTLHVYAQFSHPFTSFGVWENGEDLGEQREHSGKVSVFYADFPEGTEPLLLKAGVSYISVENARENLQAEAPHWDFDRYRADAATLWNHQLARVTAEGSKADLKKFYTCLYHVFLDPRINTDCCGDYVSAGQVKHTDRFFSRTVFSGWDVYRSEFPLLTLLQPDAVNDMINTLIEAADSADGPLPRWEIFGLETGCMVGDPGAIVLADAYCKGIRDYDTEKAWEICKKLTEGGYPGRSGREQMLQYGYIPGDISQTVENAFADWCISRFADASGHPEEAASLLRQSGNWRNIFDTDFGWMRRKDEQGRWMEEDGIYDIRGCVESNIFQQSWFVPHDIDSLIDCMGGKEVFCEKLERFLSEADLTALWNDAYNHSNEPCHTVAHLFNHAGKPWRTQYWVRRIQNEAYRAGAFGYCGNEDVGQMSGWFVLTSLGFHSTTAASGRFDLNTPYLPSQTIQLDPRYHSRTVSDRLIIETDRDPKENWYIRSVTLNGEPINRSYVTWDELTAGGVLHFDLSPEPCVDWGVEK
ncbi:MAG: GH92 family glycosyl hydrolase [Oscillospiraceae bacterium]|nr:GH92 family glycosyl hydrolase [Oscillospiraceae bacterium]